MWLAVLHLGLYEAIQVVKEVQSDHSAGDVKPQYLHDCLNHIPQIALVANKYPTLFYLKGAKGRWIRVISAKIAIMETVYTVCKQLIHNK